MDAAVTTRTAPRRWRPWPRSLFGRVALILFCGLSAAHLLSLALLLHDRAQAVSAMMVAYLARDVASSVAILERVPAAERLQWLPRLDRKNYRYRLGLEPSVPRPASTTASQVATAVARELGPGRTVIATAPADSRDPLRFDLRLALADRTPLTLEMLPPESGLSPFVIAALTAQFALLGLFSWIAVRLATRPLARLARAADALGPDLKGEPLKEDGPREVAHAAKAFNAMQQRIAADVSERVRILAAISHDLQSPITRMRLRTDLLDDTALKHKLQADLGAMQALIEEGLDFARSAGRAAETPVRTDLAALLESLAYDYADSGQPVGLTCTIDTPIMTAPQTLRRIVTNLVDNALKFARDVDIDARRDGTGRIVIAVLDRGPGIPEDELAAVLQPFHRVEASRNRETGGTGLGLAIAQRLAASLGGELRLANRDGGGLAASVTLPTGV
ncbi:HAMP domain-containing histidine kinase [Bradyrhizobium sp. U87765 SZCCT0131]|nr:HAMP domain-containing histidine kinase [Bradyrhizobium sp. U87765 SZCCT0131]MBR1259169.1 HAMP domain-containing histidine kinase [Bradyrhizobium sp. U87765 SZCCT0134]MBR1305310.1 HAMP domain-containing histidine kinase [Bradyrhizobium sp. U87765 SZCCT0110]MBR1321096.1 HAMP domain-containing histidine kinase [Bradyrhizobium sp. U87765 SZCCT0109]MBR1350250.1 HAMP domain-containing histidine kinase [Bradyrhizobium sp. U87765 SZCCT0048]